MKHLVIAEKPSVARDIARVLGCSKKTNSYIEGKDYVVTWALGHLVTLADPEEYGEQFKTWRLDTLPMLPDQWKLVVIKQTSRQYHAVKEQIFRKDISDIVIATDAGREGELVARWILEKAGNRKPLKRLWISSVTDKAIREGFSHLRPGKDYENLYHAAVARAEADWEVGINATRALTCKYNAQLSCGRVQTPTLAMIAAREEEIKKFVPKSYYGLKAVVKGISFTWTDAKNNSGRTFDKTRIEAIYKNADQKIRITEVKKKSKKTYSPALYDLTALQREANQRYGYSAKETLNIMQRLYENHKVLTYPRTDSRYLTTDMTGTLKERLKACAVGPYRKAASRLSMQEIKADKSFVNNAKVSDHHAIIPTEQFVQLEHMSNDERKIYDLVVRRFLAVLSPACEYEEISLTGMIGNETFRAKGSRILKAGWREIYDADWDDIEDEDTPDNSGSTNISSLTGTSWPDVREGSELPVTSLSITEERQNRRLILQKVRSSQQWRIPHGICSIKTRLWPALWERQAGLEPSLPVPTSSKSSSAASLWRKKVRRSILHPREDSSYPLCLRISKALNSPRSGNSGSNPLHRAKAHRINSWQKSRITRNHLSARSRMRTELSVMTI